MTHESRIRPRVWNAFSSGVELPDCIEQDLQV